HDLVHDRAVTRRADRLLYLRGAFHLDDFLALARRFPLAVVKIAIQMSRIGFFLIKVAERANVVRDAPGDAAVAADHHGGQTGERDTGHVEAAAGQPDLVPDRHGVERNMRIACDDRFARCNALAGENPIVAASWIIAATVGQVAQPAWWRR